MLSSNEVQTLDLVFSNEFLTDGIDYYLAAANTKEQRLLIVNTFAKLLEKALNVQRNDAEKSIKISAIAKHVKDFIDRFLDKIDDIELRVKLLFNLGSHYSRNSELLLAKQQFLNAKTLFESYNLSNKMLLSNILQTYGTTHIRLGEDDLAIEFLRQSLELRKTLVSPNDYGENGYNAIHHTAISYSSAFIFSNKSIKLKSKAVPILNDAITLFEKAFTALPDSTYLAYQIAEGYLLMGHFHRLNGDYTKAEENLNKSLALYNKHFKNGHIDLVRVYNFLALIHLDQGREETAVKFFEQAILEAKKISGTNHHLYETYYQLSQLTRKINPSKSYEYILACVKLCKAVYGENHPTSLSVKKLQGEFNIQYPIQKDTYAGAENLLQFKPAVSTATPGISPPSENSMSYK